MLSLAAFPALRFPTSLSRYGALFALSIGLFCVRQLGSAVPEVVADLLVVGSCASCGWSWLLTRAMFAPAGTAPTPWPLAVVLLLTAVGALLQWSDAPDSGLLQMAANLQALVSSTVLLLAIAEPIRTWRQTYTRREWRFRVAFVAVYASLVAVSALWLGRAPEGSFAARNADTVKVVCALLALLTVALALSYRARHPLPTGGNARRASLAPEEQMLAIRIQALLAQGALTAQTHLKVADLAQQLGVAEYKVTRTISGALGFRNFNQMVNHVRIERARAMLADTALSHLPVLTIALDCGFGSIGPFNRAFKQRTGLTPTAYRQQRLSQPNAGPRR
jgi:AraC-like DNA-binding protein